MSAYVKPLPDVSEPSWAPFWEGTRRHELRFQHCTQYGHLRWPPAAVCPQCFDRSAEWRAVDGSGSIFSFAIYHRAFDKRFAGDVPYNVALVELDAGPILLSSITACANDDLEVGLRVVPTYVEATDEVTLPYFRPREEPSS
jgi:uncharacterized OB-fold protein